MNDLRTRNTLLLLALAIAGASVITLVIKHRPPNPPITVTGNPGMAIPQPPANPNVASGTLTDDASPVDAAPPAVPTGSDLDQPANTPGSSPDSGAVTVDVGGAVQNATVYTLPAGSRVIDAIRAAGGPTADANLQSVDQAAKLTDGEKVFIPSQSTVPGDNLAQTPLSGGNTTIFDPTDGSVTPRPGAAGKLKNPGDGTIDINTASLEDLERLPDVGPAMAQRIVDFRQQSGQFQSPDDLMNVKGIGPKKFAKMAPFVTVQ